MKKLILTVGLPRSGKTTWAREEAKKGIPVLETDAIWASMGYDRYREITLEEAKFVERVLRTSVEALFLSGNDTVILCHTHLSRLERERWISSKGLWTRSFRFFSTSYKECQKRALELGEEWLLDFEAQAKRAELISEEEIREGEQIIGDKGVRT